MFSLTGDELLSIAEISRLTRDDEGKLIGYQRPEVRRHVQNIVEYLESGNVVFPNSIILALSSAVVFKQSRGPQVDDGAASSGTLEIPVPEPGEPKPAWIVDGQQRTLALAHSQRKKSSLPVPINAFIADDVDLQRDQFLRVNNTRPLPRGLVDELLPEVSTVLPSNLAARKVPSALCEMLDHDPESPFHGLIRRASSGNARREKAVVTDTVLIRMLQDNFASPSGALFPYRNIATGATDFKSVRTLLLTYWTAVKRVFADAWGLRPERSRLMHGVGIRSMGRLMDRVMTTVDLDDPKNQNYVEHELTLIAPYCHWTNGAWEDLGGARWNELQNLPSHVRMLSNFLVRTYLNERRKSL